MMHKIIIIFFFCLLICSDGLGMETGSGVAGTEAAPIVGSIRVDIKGPVSDGARLEETARQMILCPAGVPFSAKAFEKSLDLLKSSGLFQHIHVPDPDWAREEIVLVFQLTPFQRIREIYIKGAFPVFKQEVLNAMTLQVGGAYLPEKMVTWKKNIVKLFQDQGYITPDVAIGARKGPQDGQVSLHVTIKKGNFYKIGRLTILGNRAFSTSRLKLRMSLWQASLFPGGISRFVQQDLDRDVKGLLSFYRTMGYADARVGATVEIDRAGSRADILVTITEGPCYDIRFEGNRAYWGWLTLKKELTLSKSGNRNGAGLKKSIRNIINRYRVDGYLDARVEVKEAEITKKNSIQRRLRLIIHEGPQSIVREIQLKGIRSFPMKQIKQLMFTRTPGLLAKGAYTPKKVADDMAAIKAFYVNEGYRQIKIDKKIDWYADAKGRPTDMRLARITLLIDEGPRTRVSDFTVNGVTALTESSARDLVTFKQGDALKTDALSGSKDKLASTIAEKGYPLVQVQEKVIPDPDPTRAAVVFDVDQGPRMEMGAIYYTGNFRTDPQIFDAELDIHSGDPFSSTRILKGQRNIQNIAAVKAASYKLPGLKEKAEKVSLIVAVEEAKPFWFEMSGGYDAVSHLYFNLKGGDRNLLGRNKDLSAGLGVSEIGYRMELAFTEPRIFKSRISSTTSVYAENREDFNQSFGISSQGLSQIFSRSFMEGKLKSTLTLQLERRDQYRQSDAPISPEDEEAYSARTSLVATPFLLYNTTDSFTRPTRGVYASAMLDISKGLENSLDDFLKYRLEARTYYTPVHRLTLAVRARYGSLHPWTAGSNIPEDQLFFMGGTASVRGFDENMLRVDAYDDPVGGRESLLGNLELRYDLGMNFEATAFYDIGRIRKTENSDISDAFRSATGLGLRYVTPIGAIGVLYGWKLDPMAGESSGRFHFSIGYTF